MARTGRATYCAAQIAQVQVCMWAERSVSTCKRAGMHARMQVHIPTDVQRHIGRAYQQSLEKDTGAV